MLSPLVQVQCCRFSVAKSTCRDSQVPGARCLACTSLCSARMLLRPTDYSAGPPLERDLQRVHH